MPGSRMGGGVGSELQSLHSTDRAAPPAPRTNFLTKGAYGANEVTTSSKKYRHTSLARQTGGSLNSRPARPSFISPGLGSAELLPSLVATPSL